MTVRASEESGSDINRNVELTQANGSDFRRFSFQRSSVSVMVVFDRNSPSTKRLDVDGHPGVRGEMPPINALHRPIAGGLLTEVMEILFSKTSTRSGLMSSLPLLSVILTSNRSGSILSV